MHAMYVFLNYLGVKMKCWLEEDTTNNTPCLPCRSSGVASGATQTPNLIAVATPLPLAVVAGLISEGSAEMVFESCWSSMSVAEWQPMMWGRTLWWRGKCNVEVARQGWWRSHMWADMRRLVDPIWA
jgi:hypothetical protein